MSYCITYLSRFVRPKGIEYFAYVLEDLDTRKRRLTYREFEEYGRTFGSKGAIIRGVHQDFCDGADGVMHKYVDDDIREGLKQRGLAWRKHFPMLFVTHVAPQEVHAAAEAGTDRQPDYVIIPLGPLDAQQRQTLVTDVAKTLGARTDLARFNKDIQTKLQGTRLAHLVAEIRASLFVEPLAGCFRPAATPPQPRGAKQRRRIPDTSRREHAFFYIDVVKSSCIMKNPDNKPADVQETFDRYMALVEDEAVKQMEPRSHWSGEGGLFVFRGSGCQQRAFEAAKAALLRLEQFSRDNDLIQEPIRVRVGVHTGYLPVPGPKSVGKIMDQSIYDVVDLQRKAQPNTILVTIEAYRQLDDAAKKPFKLVPAEKGAVACYCYRL